MSLQFRSLLKPDVRTKAFICGCGHSGTSLLANILAGHPDIYVPLRETNTFLKPMSVKWRLWNLLREAKASGSPVMVEKTPRHIHHMDLIRRLVPGARFILPVRDGRDVAASIRNRSGKLAPSIERWIKDNSIVATERGKQDVLVYRHEDFVADPGKWLQDICNFIEVEYSDSLLDYHKQPKAWEGVKDLKQTDGVGKRHLQNRAWQVNQPIFDNSGRWRKELTEADVAPLTTGEGSSLMRSFGYL